MNVVKALSLAILLTTTHCMHAEQPISTLKVVTENFPPYSYTDKRTEIVSGLSTEIVESVLRKAELKSKIEVYPWARAYYIALNTPNTLIYSIKRTKERENLFHWIGKIIKHEAHFITQDRIDTEIFASIEAVKQLRIGVTRNGAIHRALKDDGFTRILPEAKRETLYRYLKSGIIDIWCTDYLSAYYVVESMNEDAAKLKILQTYKKMSKSSLYIAMSINSDPEIIYKLKKSFISVKNSEEYENILRKYSAIGRTKKRHLK